MGSLEAVPGQESTTSRRVVLFSWALLPTTPKCSNGRGIGGGMGCLYTTLRAAHPFKGTLRGSALHCFEGTLPSDCNIWEVTLRCAWELCQELRATHLKDSLQMWLSLCQPSSLKEWGALKCLCTRVVTPGVAQIPKFPY